MSVRQTEVLLTVQTHECQFLLFTSVNFIQNSASPPPPARPPPAPPPPPRHHHHHHHLLIRTPSVN